MPEETLKRLGNILTGKVERDAVHIAVAPVIAGENLKPGDHVNFVNGKAFLKYHTVVNSIGIVDPYLTKNVKAGEQFYLFLYPGSITSLRHEWTHSAFEDKSEKEEENYWIKSFAEGVGLSYKELMDGAKDFLETGEYLSRGGLLEGEYVPDEFWNQYEEVTGEKISGKRRESFFSCSC